MILKAPGEERDHGLSWPSPFHRLRWPYAYSKRVELCPPTCFFRNQKENLLQMNTWRITCLFSLWSPCITHIGIIAHSPTRWRKQVIRETLHWALPYQETPLIWRYSACQTQTVVAKWQLYTSPTLEATGVATTLVECALIVDGKEHAIIPNLTWLTTRPSTKKNPCISKRQRRIHS